MTLPTFATVTDIEERLRVTFDESESDQVAAWLTDASVLVRAESGQDWVDEDGELAGTPAQLEALQSVTAGAVARMVRNPDAATQEAAGPFSRSLQGQDGPWLTKGDKRVLGRLTGEKLWTLGTTRGDLETRPVRDDTAWATVPADDIDA